MSVTAAREEYALRRDIERVVAPQGYDALCVDPNDLVAEASRRGVPEEIVGRFSRYWEEAQCYAESRAAEADDRGW